MNQASREMTLRRIDAALDRLARAIQNVDEAQASQGDADVGGAEMVSKESHEALLAAHSLLRSRAEAAVAGIDRLLQSGKPG